MAVKLSKKRNEEIMRQFGGRMPTPEEIFQKIIESQQRMMDALQGAYNAAPAEPEEKAKLLEAIDKSVKLKEKIEKDLKPKLLKKSKK